jgi:RNA ligase (TIGR02306 family)
VSRKLASVQRIESLAPIEGADKIEVAKVLGWSVVVGKGEFAPGEPVVYCEIDSVLPEAEWSEFMSPRGYRVRTIKLRGQVSQGICFPLSILPSTRFTLPEELYEVGDDVTEILGVTKHEPPIPTQLAGVQRGSFPPYIPRTDETRVQVLGDLLERHAGLDCFVTEKLDGSSLTALIDPDGTFRVCSRNIDLVEAEDNAFWQAARKFDLEAKLRTFGGPVAIQGEIIGPGIQANRLQRKELEFYAFQVFVPQPARYLDLQAFVDFCFERDIPTVPFVTAIHAMWGTPEPYIRHADGMKSLLNPHLLKHDE